MCGEERSDIVKRQEDRALDSYHTVYKGGTAEIVEKKSRFIAEVFPVSSEEEAMEYLEETRKKYWDARHHCWAYVTGRNPASERMSDDGEPAGTAGKPILEVIRGRGLTDVFVVVTRYFGGTLLGTGGLVRAYTSAAAEGLESSTLITKIRGFRQKITTDYTGLGKIQYILGQRKIPVLDSVYTDKVEVSVVVDAGEKKSLEKEITEGTNGQAVMEDLEECWFADTPDGIQIYSGMD